MPPAYADGCRIDGAPSPDKAYLFFTKDAAYTREIDFKNKSGASRPSAWRIEI